MEEAYIWKGNKKLRCGYTTGSCAAAAAKAALTLLLTGRRVEAVELTLPAGKRLLLPVERQQTGTDPAGNRFAMCGVAKDGGDDPDATHGLLIAARVSLQREPGIEIAGGPGVGRITRPGLDQSVGEAAINRVPRSMIQKAVEEVMESHGKSIGTGGEPAAGVRVEIQVPGGEAAAAKTFNPRLGIVGGISILGTTGIVVPMSEEALKESIRAEIRQQVAEGAAELAAAPGNYGRDALAERFGLREEQIVLCSNYIGETMDMAAQEGARGVLLCGHMGKLVKVAAGIMNTHSREADARMETLAAQTLLAGGSRELALQILQCGTTDEAWRYLRESGNEKAVAGRLLDRMKDCLNRRTDGKLRIEIILYSHLYGILGMTDGAGDMAGRMTMI